MTQPAPLTPRAIDVACDADIARISPFQRVTRIDTAISPDRDTPPTLHGERHGFDLWACAGKAVAA